MEIYNYYGINDLLTEDACNLERAKAIMAKFDPTLLSAALSEMMIEAEEAEKDDVEKAKEAIKKIYDSIPEDKDKTRIVSKAITELNSDIVEREVKAIKRELASIDNKTLMLAAGDYVADIWECKSPIYLQACFLGCINYKVDPCKWFCIKSCLMYCLHSCLTYCINYSVCFNNCLSRKIIPDCRGGCPLYAIYECRAPLGIDISGCKSIAIDIEDPWKWWEMNPYAKEQLKKEIIQEMLQTPELSRAMKKLMRKIQEEE